MGLGWGPRAERCAAFLMGQFGVNGSLVVIFSEVWAIWLKLNHIFDILREAHLFACRMFISFKLAGIPNTRHVDTKESLLVEIEVCE